MAPNKRGSKAKKAQARSQKQAPVKIADANKTPDAVDAADLTNGKKTKSRGVVSGALVLAISMGVASIVLGLIVRGATGGATTGSSTDVPAQDPPSNIKEAKTSGPSGPVDGSQPLRTDPQKRVVPTEILASLSSAVAKGDVVTAQSLGNTVLESSSTWLMRKAADELYERTEAPFLDLSVYLLQRAYDLTYESKSAKVTDKRRATYMLGQSLENRGDSSAAWALYNRAVEQRLWALPDQRPQHYFPFIKAGPPFPDPSDYADAVEMLESNFEVIRRELIMHQRFPGKLTVDTEKLAVSGRWLQADFLLKGKWHEEHVKRFPRTARVLHDISERFAYKMPDGVMQMSTMVKGTHIRPHCGSGNHKVRLHLALYVPEGCEIIIANTTDKWTVGKVLVVDDSYVHSVRINSTEPRTVLIVDVWVRGISEEAKEKVREYFMERDLLLSLSSNRQPNR